MRWSKRTSNGFALLIIGLGIGWFVGLSTSPVIHIVVASLITATVAVATAIAEFWNRRSGVVTETSVNDSGPALITAAPLAIVIVGAVAGSTAGLYVRTHDWFGAPAVKMDPAPAPVPAPAPPPGANSPSYRASVFFTVSVAECSHFRAEAIRGELRNALLSAGDSHVKRFAKSTQDEAALKSALEELICPDSASRE